MHQGGRLQARKHGCEQCRIENSLKKRTFANVLWGRKSSQCTASQNEAEFTSLFLTKWTSPLMCLVLNLWFTCRGPLPQMFLHSFVCDQPSVLSCQGGRVEASCSTPVARCMKDRNMHLHLTYTRVSTCFCFLNLSHCGNELISTLTVSQRLNSKEEMQFYSMCHIDEVLQLCQS